MERCGSEHPCPSASREHLVTYPPYRFHRGMTRPFFSKDRISHFEIFDRHATDAIKQVKARMSEGYAVDVQVGTCTTHQHFFSLSSRMSSLGSPSILRRSPSLECLCLHLGSHVAPDTHNLVSQGRSFTLSRSQLPAFRSHPILQKSPGEQICRRLPDRTVRGRQAKSVGWGLEAWGVFERQNH